LAHNTLRVIWFVEEVLYSRLNLRLLQTKA